MTIRFYSKVAGSAYVFPDGTKIEFRHGFIDITPENFPGKVMSPNPQFKLPDDGRLRHEAYAEELDKLCKSGNPLIFTQETVHNLQDVGKEYKLDASTTARTEAEVARAENAMRNSGQGFVETGDVNRGTTGGGDTNQSTVDPALQAVVLAPAVVGPGASKIAELRAAAAARNAK